MNNKLRRWLIIGVSEVILAFMLLAISPTFLNSKKPIFGFLIWFTVPTVIASSSIYAIAKVISASKARNIFITSFPQYSALKTADFLELSPKLVASQIELLTAIDETSNLQELDISLFEVLEQTKHEKN